MGSVVYASAFEERTVTVTVSVLKGTDWGGTIAAVLMVLEEYLSQIPDDAPWTNVQTTTTGGVTTGVAAVDELEALREAVRKADQRMREVEAPADFDAYLGSAYGLGVLASVKTLREETEPHMEEVKKDA